MVDGEPVVTENGSVRQMATVVCVREFGPPAQAARVEQWDLPEPLPHQVRVKVLASPVNPADLNLIEGTYAIRPPRPFVVGMEGVGIVAACGRDVHDLAPGQWVIAPVRAGWWSTERVLDAADLIPLPADVPRAAAAMLTVNPPTAYRMLHDFVPLAPGDWLVQNGANSAVGRAVIQIARHCGWRTVNVVRRPELIAELQALGADVVVTGETPLSRQIRDLTGGAELRLGLNAVGGESARQLAKSLAPHGTLVTYGAMAREPLTVDNRALIFQDIRFRGFWVSDWFRQASRPQITEMFAALLSLVRAGRLAPPVAGTYPLTAAREAVGHAAQSSRTGKILFVMD